MQRRKRNPDPVDVSDYLAQPFISAIIRAGNDVYDTKTGTTTVTQDGVGRYDVQLPLARGQFSFSLNRRPVGSLSVLNLMGDEVAVAHVLARAADAAGFVVEWDGEGASFTEQGFIDVDPKWGTGIYVPTWFSDRARFAKRYYEARDDASLVSVAKVIAENIFRGVPKAYRKQIGALVLAAYETNDLGTYLQAKELAALVAE
jgi:hypothetical protein